MNSPRELGGMRSSIARPLEAGSPAPPTFAGLVHLNRTNDSESESEQAAKPLGQRAAIDQPATPALLLTIEEAAERLQVGRCTMQSLLISGQVQSFKIGRLRRVPPAALDAYIRQQMES